MMARVLSEMNPGRGLVYPCFFLGQPNQVKRRGEVPALPPTKTWFSIQERIGPPAF